MSYRPHLFVIYLSVLTRVSFCQTILNGNFENNSCPSNLISGCVSSATAFPGYFPFVYYRSSNNQNNCTNGTILKNTCCDLKADFNLKRAPSGSTWFAIQYQLASYKQVLSFQLSNPLTKFKPYVIRIDAANLSNNTCSDDTLQIGLSDSIIFEQQRIANIYSLDSFGFRTYAKLFIPDSQYLFIQLSRTNLVTSRINDFAIDNVRLDTCIHFGIKQNVALYKCANAPAKLNVSTVGVQYLWSNFDTLPYSYVLNEGLYLSYTYDANQCATIDSFIVKYTDTTYTTTDTVICKNQFLDLTNKSLSGSSYLWSNGDTTSNTTINSEGKYSLVINYANGCYAIDSFNVKLDQTNPPNLSVDTGLCPGSTMILNAYAPQYLHYFWSTGDTTYYISINKVGNYKVTVTDGTCTLIDSVLVYIYELQPLQLPNDTIVCFEDIPTLNLDAGVWNTYFWSPNGESSRIINISASGEYKVLVSDLHNCFDSTSVLVKNECIRNVYIPNSFTPNDDGINDFFEIKSNDINDIKMDLYDRWGGHVVHLSGVFIKWDGKVSGMAVQDGAYVYLIKYITNQGEFSKKGLLTIIH